MADLSPQPHPEPTPPSRSSILVAAARAFGSREPDQTIRNPDLLADRLIGPDELVLLGDHPLAKALEQDCAEASQILAVVGFAWLMLLRTRFIDDALERAIKNGATQVVILGAGFDTRAYRFQELLKDCKVFEVDAAPTQEYKRRRVAMVLPDLPQNLIHVKVDFAKDDLGNALRTAGLKQNEKTFYIWEGVTMYLPDESVRKTLQTLASLSVPGSSVVLDYVNSLGIELGKFTPQGAGGLPASWGEPWIFGVPGANGSEFFHELGFDPGVPVVINDPDLVKRDLVGKDGVTYGAHVFEKARAAAEAKAKEAAQAPPPPPPEALAELRKAITAAGGVYWLAEITVRP